MRTLHSFANQIWAAFFLLIPPVAAAQYTGSGSVTQGRATTTVPVLYQCTGGRPTALGTITSGDGASWTVPADVRFQDASMPYASDLYNSCNAALYRSASEALSHLNGADIITIDPDGELITGFIFADNYVEVCINGTPVGKDRVPFTPFNSSIVRFKVRRPFNIAMLLVDWEENLGLGSENNNGVAYHPGDGGMVAVFRDANDSVIATTNGKWKAQTFYTSPIKDLSCATENGELRLTNTCNTAGVNNGESFYALHWAVPPMWASSSFDDSMWPFASTYTNAQIGVDNKPAYTNFTDIFDDPAQDAQFIWSSNVILDNEVIVRFTVDAPTSVEEGQNSLAIVNTQIYTITGALVGEQPGTVNDVLERLGTGLYCLRSLMQDGTVRCRIIVKQ